MKKIITLTIATGILALSSANGVTLRKDNSGRSEKIINRNILQVDLTSSGKGWIVYPSNFNSGKWWNSYWGT